MDVWASLSLEDDQQKQAQANTLGALIKTKADDDGDNDDDRDCTYSNFYPEIKFCGDLLKHCGGENISYLMKSGDKMIMGKQTKWWNDKVTRW